MFYKKRSKSSENEESSTANITVSITKKVDILEYKKIYVLVFYDYIEF